MMIETLLIIFLFLGGFIWTVRRQKKESFRPPKTTASDRRTYNAYEAMPSLFVNKSELAFFHTLRRVLPKEYHLHSKTRLEDIVGVKPYIKGEGRWKLRARVKSRHVDFLITDDNGRAQIVIELDGPSHNTEAENADKLKNGIFEAVGLRLIRVRTGENFALAAQNILKFLNDV